MKDQELYEKYFNSLKEPKISRTLRMINEVCRIGVFLIGIGLIVFGIVGISL